MFFCQFCLGRLKSPKVAQSYGDLRWLVLVSLLGEQITLASRARETCERNARLRRLERVFLTARRMNSKIHASKLLAREISDGARDQIRGRVVNKNGRHERFKIAGYLYCFNWNWPFEKQKWKVYFLKVGRKMLWWQDFCRKWSKKGLFNELKEDGEVNTPSI